MKKATHRILSVMATVTILSTGSGAWSETGPSGRPLHPAELSVQKQATIEHLIRKQKEVLVKSLQSDAETGSGDPKLLRELLEQGDRENRTLAVHRATVSLAHADLTASRP